MPSHQLIVTAEPELDFAEAFCWYQEQASLGAAFMSDVGKQFEHIASFPFACPVVAHGVRRAVVQRYPHNVYYSVNGEFVDVLAVWHGSRDQRRLLATRLGSWRRCRDPRQAIFARILGLKG